MALAGSKDISQQHTEESSLCTFFGLGAICSMNYHLPSSDLPVPSPASHGSPTFVALSRALYIRHGC